MTDRHVNFVLLVIYENLDVHIIFFQQIEYYFVDCVLPFRSSAHLLKAKRVRLCFEMTLSHDKTLRHYQHFFF